VVSNPVSLKVNPLPAYTGDDPFSGLVGLFTISTALDKLQIKAGESATLTITIQGRGNIMDAGVPDLDLPKGRFKVYADTPVEEIGATEFGFAGKKIFKQAIVSAIPGEVTIPALTLTYFDVAAKAYKQISTQPIQLQILPGEPTILVDSGAEDASVSPPAPNSEKQAVVMRNRDILDIRESISAISPDSHLSLFWFFILVLVPGVGFGCLTLFVTMKTREKSVSDRYRAKAKESLAAAQKTSPGGAQFLGLVHSALTAAILSRGDKQAEGLTREEAKAILSDAGEKRQTMDTALGLMDTLDAVRFGGSNMDEKKAVSCLSSVQGLIKTILLACCLTFALSFYQAPSFAADTAGIFVDATRAYQEGNYQGAVQKFEAVAAGVKNPALFYNLGNAYLKSNDLGRAILWYERAKRLSPNDPDLKFNLAHALGRLKDKTDSGFSPMDILFFWQGLISLKWLQFLSIGASFIFFTWAGTRKSLKKRIFSSPGISIFIILTVLLLVTGLEAFRLNSDHRAVILKETVTVRSGTLETATQLFDLHAGTRVRVMEKKKNHLKIRFAKGKVGWVSLDEAEII